MGPILPFRHNNGAIVPRARCSNTRRPGEPPPAASSKNLAHPMREMASDAVLSGRPLPGQCRIIDEANGDLLRDPKRTEAKQVIITGVSPTFAKRHTRKRQPTQHRQSRANCGCEELMRNDSLQVHSD